MQNTNQLGSATDLIAVCTAAEILCALGPLPPPASPKTTKLLARKASAAFDSLMMDFGDSWSKQAKLSSYGSEVSLCTHLKVQRWATAARVGCISGGCEAARLNSEDTCQLTGIDPTAENPTLASCAERISCWCDPGLAHKEEARCATPLPSSSRVSVQPLRPD
jgi:hypothetical protein